MSRPNMVSWQYIPTMQIKPSKVLKKHYRRSSSRYNKSLLPLDKLINYTNIFNNINFAKRDILFIKKKEFDIFYSCKYKYPLLVKETITKLTGTTDPNEPFIDRREIEDPFREDVEIPENYRLTINNYQKYMEYGGSMGHNAPAGQHKTNMIVYSETFLLSNITPQEMVFNSGLWVIMENWCKILGRKNGITNLTVFTGSIPDNHSNIFDGLKINVPSRMFKIVAFEIPNKLGHVYLEILIANNSPYFINPEITKINLSTYLIPTKSHEWFETISGINIRNLLNFYGLSGNKINSFRGFINMDFFLSPALKLLMKKSNWFGYIIYSPNLEALEQKWKECQNYEKEFETLKYHQQYYELAKKRLIRDNNISRIPTINYSIKSLNINNQPSMFVPDIFKKTHTKTKIKSKSKYTKSSITINKKNKKLSRTKK